MSAEQVSEIVKKLDKMVSADGSGQDQALDLLNTLTGLSIAQTVLRKTKIRKTLNALSKLSKDGEVIKLVKQLIKNWKQKRVPANNSSSNSTKNPVPAHCNPIPDNVSVPPPVSIFTESPTKSQIPDIVSVPPPVSISTESPTKSQIADIVSVSPPVSIPDAPSAVKVDSTSQPASINDRSAVRSKSRALLSVALKGVAMPDGSADPDELAGRIEDCVFNKLRNTDMKYRNRIRSLIFNFKDPKNPCLRENVLLGQISVEKIGVMTTHEMASAEMKDLRESFIKTLALKRKRAATEFDSSCAVKTVKQKKIEETMNEQMMDTYLRYNL
uniref:TFIIS N-terminal domain-containing protein n=1 Tax=Strigamia maritima TaxID=126957 RepID=T1IM35_STRMM